MHAGGGSLSWIGGFLFFAFHQLDGTFHCCAAVRGSGVVFFTKCPFVNTRFMGDFFLLAASPFCFISSNDCGQLDLFIGMLLDL